MMSGSMHGRKYARQFRVVMGIMSGSAARGPGGACAPASLCGHLLCGTPRLRQGVGELAGEFSNKPYILSILSYMHVIYENIHKRVFCCASQN